MEEDYIVKLTTATEPYSSNSLCGFCSSQEAGTRAEATIRYKGNDEIYEVQICADCVADYC
jgi:hypothetical protein